VPSYQFYCTHCMLPFVITVGSAVVHRHDIKCPACGRQKSPDVIGPIESVAAIGSRMVDGQGLRVKG
jgi:hypothetical protein